MINQDQGSTSIGIGANLAALLSYALGFVSGIFFCVIEKKNKFVRFHAIQSTLVFAFLFVLSFIIRPLPLVGLKLYFGIGFISIILWVFLMFKAYQGQYFKIPLAGNLAQQNS